MTKEGLDVPHVRAAVQQMNRDRMPAQVAMQVPNLAPSRRICHI
jgi:hypothetical protein